MCPHFTAKGGEARCSDSRTPRCQAPRSVSHRGLTLPLQRAEGPGIDTLQSVKHELTHQVSSRAPITETGELVRERPSAGGFTHTGSVEQTFQVLFNLTSV